MAKKKHTPLEDLPALTPQQERFCQEYIIDLNATQAAIRAGYSEKTANQQGPRLLVNVGIAARVAELPKTVADKAGITALGVLQEFKRVAMADFRELFDENGQLRPIKDLPDDLAASLASIEVERRVDGHGEEAEVYHVHKVKRWDKLRALESLAKHLGLLVDKTEISGKNGGPVIVEIQRFADSD
jgi:phage terminase small subunit